MSVEEGKERLIGVDRVRGERLLRIVRADENVDLAVSSEFPDLPKDSYSDALEALNPLNNPNVSTEPAVTHVDAVRQQIDLLTRKDAA